MNRLGITLTSCLSITLATPIADIDSPWNSIRSIVLGGSGSTTSSVPHAASFTMARSLNGSSSVSTSSVSASSFDTRGFVNSGSGILVSLPLTGNGSISTRILSMSGSMIVIMLLLVDVPTGSTPNVGGGSHAAPTAELCELAVQFGKSR
jgi:hypothetical protein